MRCLPLADDCGVSDANTESIMECIDAGSLAGTSLLAGGASLEKAAFMLGGRLQVDPALRVGVHLNILEGYCTAPAASVPLLAEADGRFRYSLGRLYRKLILSSLPQRMRFNEQVAVEWQAQIDLVQGLLTEAAGAIRPLYLDGHQHVHAIPELRPALSTIISRNTFLHVRVPQEIRYFVRSTLKKQLAGNIRRELLAHWSRSLRQYLNSVGQTTPAFFIGSFSSGSMNQMVLAAGLSAVAKRAKKDDLVEIMLHPGGYSKAEMETLMGQTRTAGEELFFSFYIAPERASEKDMLLSAGYRQLLSEYDPERSF